MPAGCEAMPRSKFVRALRAGATLLLILITLGLIAVIVLPAYMMAHPDPNAPPPRIAPFP
jgi:hypothetical protein